MLAHHYKLAPRRPPRRASDFYVVSPTVGQTNICCTFQHEAIRDSMSFDPGVAWINLHDNNGNELSDVQTVSASHPGTGLHTLNRSAAQVVEMVSVLDVHSCTLAEFSDKYWSMDPMFSHLEQRRLAEFDAFKDLILDKLPHAHAALARLDMGTAYTAYDCIPRWSGERNTKAMQIRRKIMDPKQTPRTATSSGGTRTRVYKPTNIWMD